MLSTCPECELPVSDKAIACPHCGYPLKSENIIRTQRTKRKEHMRLPNGFGQISKVKSKNLRKPYRAMVTVGKKENGRPICKLLQPEAYFETYNDAYKALMEYNKNPYELDSAMTVQELYEKWSAEYFEKLADNSKRTITCAWVYCKKIYNMNVRDVRVVHLKGCIDETESNNNRSRIKSTFNMMFDYAIEKGIIEHNYARDFKVEGIKAISGHSSFTDEEMNIMWKNTSIPLMNAVLLQCYMGWRPQELCKLEIKNIDMEKWAIVGGMKTEAGTNRIVPVHSCARDLVKKLLFFAESVNSKTLVCDYDGKPLSYDKYYKRFAKLMEEVGIKEHRPHDCRKQFITMCKNSGVDEYAIKRMAGHAIDDITEAIYTDRDPNWLSEEIEKIRGPV